MRLPLLAVLLAAIGAGASGLDRARVSPPGTDWSLEFPTGWRKSYGRRTVILRPSGRDERAVRFRLEEHGGDPKAFADRLAASAGKLKRLESRESRELAGREGERLEFVETQTLPGRYGALPGPLREVYHVVPRPRGFLVLAWEGFGSEYERRKPELESIAGSLRWNAAPPR